MIIFKYYFLQNDKNKQNYKNLTLRKLKNSDIKFNKKI